MKSELLRRHFLASFCTFFPTHPLSRDEEKSVAKRVKTEFFYAENGGDASESETFTGWWHRVMVECRRCWVDGDGKCENTNT